MNLAQTVAKNFAWLSLGQIGSRVLKFFILVYAARVLGAGGYGSFAIAFSFVSIFFVGASLFNVLGPIVRDLAAKDYTGDERYLTTVFSFRLLLAIGAVVLILTFFPFLSNRVAFLLLLPLALAAMFDFVDDFFTALLHAENQMERAAIPALVENALVLGAGYWFLLYFGSPEALAAAYLLGAIASITLFAILARRRYGKLGFMPEPVYLKRIIRQSFGFGLIWAALITFFLPFLTLLVSVFSSVEKVGIFYAVTQLLQMLMLPAMLLAAAALPTLSSLTKDPERFFQASHRLFAAAFSLTLPMLFGGLVLGRPIARILFGEAFAGIGSLFKISLVSLPFFYTTILILHIILAQDELPRYANSIKILFGGGILLSILFTSVWGALGGALTIIAVYVLAFALLAYQLRKKKGELPFSLADIREPLAASVIMGIVLATLKTLNLNVWVLFAIGTVFYGGLIAVFRPSFLFSPKAPGNPKL